MNTNWYLSKHFLSRVLVCRLFLFMSGRFVIMGVVSKICVVVGKNLTVVLPSSFQQWRGAQQTTWQAGLPPHQEKKPKETKRGTKHSEIACVSVMAENHSASEQVCKLIMMCWPP